VNQPQCSCAQFERLKGASVPAYIKAFLEESGRSGTEKNLYRCRVCGREWERRAPDVKAEGTRASLVRLSNADALEP
jgi:hypothetical protein